MQEYQLAQINIAYGFEEIDHPAMAEFKAAIDMVNALAESSEGFVWRLQTEEGDATALRLFDDPRVIINVSVWESIEALRDYVYQGEHLAILRRKKEWFRKSNAPHLAMWWIPRGHFPSAEEAKQRLELLDRAGPSRDAFTFAKPFEYRSDTDMSPPN